ncbi:MAG: 3-phosphoshikimate 1-carboxyvinyltransferase [Bacteroidales bacterium]|nr:3-phosphoshikimate 1-carboxyvinyltransferase [Bacteroidales bacterium]
MILRSNSDQIKAQVSLPGSKSISNRALMIGAYSDIEMNIAGLSRADDTIMLHRNLEFISNCSESSIPMVIDCGNAGTVFRFLLSYLASTPGQWMLTGTIRMKARPVADLVTSLRNLGAEIYYVEEEGFPPVRIIGKQLPGGKTSVSMEKSSQFASSLLMAAPVWSYGLELELTDNLSSMPYLEMTLRLMERFGAKIKRAERKISVLPLPYKKAPLIVEPDWSSAAFWYELVALSEQGEILMKDLLLESLQGDRVMTTMFSQLGVETFQEPDGILIFKTGKIANEISFDLNDYPDMLPALVATCCGLGKEAHFTGLENLQYKESDRTAALQKQMTKIGCSFEKITTGHYHLKPGKPIEKATDTVIRFETYSDHRMAMAFAPLAMKLGVLEIENPEAVEKSYPNYWEELFATGAIGKELS